MEVMQRETSVPYADIVADIKKTYSSEYVAAQNTLGVHVKCYKDWDKNDLVALYDAYFGKATFYHLVRLIQQARREEKARLASPNDKILAFAQKDLNELAPTGMDWKGYDRMMQDAIMEIQATSSRITRDLAALFSNTDEEMYDGTNALPHPSFGTRGLLLEGELTGFDPQSALARMDAATTQITTEAPKSAMRGAVESIRHAFTRAS